MPPKQDSWAILRVLDEFGVRYVLIGGLAAVLQGSPFPTEDADVTPERTRENLERLSAALLTMGARIFTMSEPDGLPFNHSAESLSDASVWNLQTRYGRLDISYTPNGTEGFPDLSKDAFET